MALEKRIGLLQEVLKTRGVGGVLLFYSRDIFYYTGTAQPAYLFVSPENYFLFLRNGFEFESRETFVQRDKIGVARRLEDIFTKISPQLHRKNIATELDILPAKKYLEMKEIFTGYELIDASPLVLQQRKRKDVDEIKKIEEACEAVHSGHEAVLSALREGITELELAAAVENAHRLAGHEGMFFIRQPGFFMGRGPISSGPNLARFSGVVLSVSGTGLSPAVPAGPSRRIIKKGDLVVVDIPTLVNGYHADQTRTYVLGQASQQMKTLFAGIKGIADHLIEHMRPGMKCSEVYHMAEGEADRRKLGDVFLSFGKGGKSPMIGHGIGIELNEPPILSRYDHSRLAQDHVVALELHVLQKGLGAMKLEDMILIGKKGNKILTKSPRELFEIQIVEGATTVVPNELGNATCRS